PELILVLLAALLAALLRSELPQTPAEWLDFVRAFARRATRGEDQGVVRRAWPPLESAAHGRREPVVLAARRTSPRRSSQHPQGFPLMFLQGSPHFRRATRGLTLVGKPLPSAKGGASGDESVAASVGTR